MIDRDSRIDRRRRQSRARRASSSARLEEDLIWRAETPTRGEGQQRTARSRRRSAHLRSRRRSSARRVSAVSREKKRADAVRVRLRDVTRALGRSGPTWRGWRTPSAGCRIQRSREHPGRLRAVGGIRGGSPPRISLRGSNRLSTREDVARGARVGRDSRVRHPCRSRGWKGNASLDPRPRM